jgi:hypothetical protein
VTLLIGTSDTPVWISAWATLGLALAASVALFSLIDARRTRHGQVVTELSRRWDDPFILESVTLGREYAPSGTLELVEALWASGVTKRETADLKDWYKVSAYINLLETIGVYLSERVISEGIVYKLWGNSIIEAWDDWRETVLRLRELTATPEALEHFEGLARAMAARLMWEREDEPRNWRDRAILASQVLFGGNDDDRSLV